MINSLDKSSELNIAEKMNECRNAEAKRRNRERKLKIRIIYDDERNVGRMFRANDSKPSNSITLLPRYNTIILNN